MTVDIAAVVNLHREGRAAAASVTSAWRAVDSAQTNGLSAEVFLILDDPDPATTGLAHRWEARGVTAITTRENDLGAARNVAVGSVDARWFAFLDGDDLWGQSWLVDAHALASTSSRPFDVFHPAVNIIFGDHHSLLHHVASDDPSFSWSRFRMHNMWTALSFVHRDTLRSVPYPRNDLDSGFGYEDWAWNMAILDRGGSHRVVPNTCHFIRRTTDESLLSRSQSALRSRPEREGLPSWYSATPGDSLESSPIRPDEHTHTNQPVALDEVVLEQVRLAATIEPLVEATIRSDGRPRLLPQNTQTHVLATHLALDELERSASSDRSLSRSISAIIDAAELLESLSSDDRARVVAEFLIEERRVGRDQGESAYVDEALDLYPQIRA